MVNVIETVAVIATVAMIAIVEMTGWGGITVMVDMIVVGTAIAMNGAGKNTSGVATDIGRGRMPIPTTATINTARTRTTTGITMGSTRAPTMRGADSRTTLSARTFIGVPEEAFCRSSVIPILITRLIATVSCVVTKKAFKTGSAISSADNFEDSEATINPILWDKLEAACTFESARKPSLNRFA